MTNKEACNVLMTLSNLVNVSKGWEDSAKSSVNEAVLKAIAALEERPHGKWLFESNGVNSVFRCSNCGKFYIYDTFVKENNDRYTKLEREDANRFCWHCGADMRQEEG